MQGIHKLGSARIILVHFFYILDIHGNVEAWVTIFRFGAESLFSLLQKTVNGQTRRLLYLSLSVGMALGIHRLQLEHATLHSHSKRALFSYRKVCIPPLSSAWRIWGLLTWLRWRRWYRYRLLTGISYQDSVLFCNCLRNKHTLLSSYDPSNRSFDLQLFALMKGIEKRRMNVRFDRACRHINGGIANAIVVKLCNHLLLHHLCLRYIYLTCALWQLEGVHWAPDLVLGVSFEDQSRLVELFDLLVSFEYRQRLHLELGDCHVFARSKVIHQHQCLRVVG